MPPCRIAGAESQKFIFPLRLFSTYTNKELVIKTLHVHWFVAEVFVYVPITKSIQIYETFQMETLKWPSAGRVCSQKVSKKSNQLHKTSEIWMDKRNFSDVHMTLKTLLSDWMTIWIQLFLQHPCTLGKCYRVCCEDKELQGREALWLALGLP